MMPQTPRLLALAALLWSATATIAGPYAGLHPGEVKGVINFVGDWNGTRCQHAATINQALFARGAPYPDDTL